MKTLKVILPMVLLFLFSNTITAQTNNASTKTETLKVSGKCGMCKTRIEKAAKLEGVSKAEWNKETQMLTLTYDPSKVKSNDVLKKIAEAGHDSEKFKADDKTYGGLPGCCKYR